MPNAAINSGAVQTSVSIAPHQRVSTQTDSSKSAVVAQVALSQTQKTKRSLQGINVKPVSQDELNAKNKIVILIAVMFLVGFALILTFNPWLAALGVLLVIIAIVLSGQPSTGLANEYCAWRHK